MNDNTLKKYQAISSIASYIAIPLIIAAIGFVLQSRLGDDGLNKDYVSIAVGILKNNPSAQEPDLRKWAVAVLDKHSPIQELEVLPLAQKSCLYSAAQAII
ncbi:MAG: hypothetical protein U5M23_00105 [Marinagarivorans sp.]|nr:hypothetical protein [Marinagarivorans sp.]